MIYVYKVLDNVFVVVALYALLSE